MYMIQLIISFSSAHPPPAIPSQKVWETLLYMGYLSVLWVQKVQSSSLEEALRLKQMFGYVLLNTRLDPCWYEEQRPEGKDL